MQFWYHIMPFSFLVELGLTAEWVSAEIYTSGKVGFALFVSSWTLFSLLIHWTFPFIIAGAWAVFTLLLWLIAAAVLSSSSCSNFDVGFGRSVRVCLSDFSRWYAMVAFAWINFILMIAILACIWYHVMGTKQVTWRHGLYGRSYFLKPRQHGLHGDAVGMKETSPSRPENATAAA